jgi:hypothetical protein
VARIRTIKPEFFTSEDIVGLSPLARLLYVALWCEADREGRLVWKPATFKLRYLPADNCDVQALCQEILDAGLVSLYGTGYALIPSFHAHQHINPRESESQLPAPGAVGTREARVGTRQPRVSDAQVGKEGKGKEGKGKEEGGAVALLLDKEIPEPLARDFLAIRKAKKAPLTATALAGIEREAGKAGYTLQKALETCCARGWQGFEAGWVQPKPGSAEARSATVPGPTGRDPALVKLDEDAKKAAPIPPQIKAQIDAALKGKVH